MSCGKRPLVKRWDKSRSIRIIAPSRYEQNEDSVKQHWKKVIRDLELSYKDEQFWESQCETVRNLVGPVIFQRIAKIFNLTSQTSHYEPQMSDVSSIIPSEQYYRTRSVIDGPGTKDFSMSDFEPSILEEEEDIGEEQSELWSTSSFLTEEQHKSRSKSLVRSKSAIYKQGFSKSFSRHNMSKSFSKLLSKSAMKSVSSKLKSSKSDISSDESAKSDDDLNVNHSIPRKHYRRHIRNPHFEMLYCHESETDMIKWKSKYKQKTFEVSASDEFSKKAEIMTKKISKEFYEWWVGLGNVEFKSEIKRPEDIEDLFQVWFDEHASRSLVLNSKILPCVLQSIADYIGVPRAACPNVLKRQIDYDIEAETSPAHVMAFGTCLPQKMKHIPPNNNTEKMWHSVQIPEDLRTMACVWEDVQHLTSTKAFQKWLQQRPHLPMPPCLRAADTPGDKKQLFVVPSDYVVQDKSDTSLPQDLALPVSQFSLELKEVLSKLMNQ